MDEKYDAIVLGTGLTECVISGLLSVAGKKVLHMDRNSYYGGESASLTLDQMFEKFQSGERSEALGSSRDYNVDIIPKFLMAGGNLVKLLVHTGVTRYLEFMQAEGSYVTRGTWSMFGGSSKVKVTKVPATDSEAIKSPLFSLLEKNRMRKFFQFLQKYDKEDPKTHHGMNLNTTTSLELFKSFGLQESTHEFLGHAMALYQNDDFLSLPAAEVIERIMLYGESLSRYGQSPYVYPVWGLGELPQAFARLSAIYGGVYMLNKPVAKVHYDDNGKVTGVESEGEIAKCDLVVGDPSYFPEKCKSSGQVVIAICILNHSIPNTKDDKSCQIIIPQKQVNRSHDIYIFCVSYAHKVAPDGRYIAIVSTKVETETPEAELEPGLELLGPIEQKFVFTRETFDPVDSGKDSNVYISSSYDSTTHFESTCEDVLDLYERIMGEPFDFSKEIKSGHEYDEDAQE